MMVSSKTQEWHAGFERSCRPDLESRIVAAPPLPGFDRIEASFNGEFFEPHRHDTYAIGVTMRGIQTFGYRGAKRFSQPGQIIILHPDELHDGAAATDEGLLYRMLYLEPALVRSAMADRRAALPFVDQPIIEDGELLGCLSTALDTLDRPLEDIQAADVISQITDCLVRHSQGQTDHPQTIDRDRIWQVRNFLQENCRHNISSSQLEQISGLDRYKLARQFRSEFGTSPHRFLIMRRLELARQLMSRGTSLVETAATVGFADQSHLSRHFKKAFGITPGKWAQASRIAA